MEIYCMITNKPILLTAFITEKCFIFYPVNFIIIFNSQLFLYFNFVEYNLYNDMTHLFINY